MNTGELRDQIRELEKVSEILEPSAKDRAAFTDKVRDFAIKFIDEMPLRKTFMVKDPDPSALEVRDDKLTMDEIIGIFEKEVVDNGINAASGGHLGYIPGGGLYTASLGDLLAGATNEYAGIYYASPGATLIEQKVLSWMKGLFRFPENAVGNLCSGGSIANLIALTSARDKHRIKGSIISRSVAYLSEQVHHCIQKALRIIGLEEVVIRYIPLDERHRMKVDILEEKVQEDLKSGLNPFLVIASAGTTDTGAIDPLKAIADVASTHNLWYHIDGAYGGFFIMVEEKKPLFEGIELADSLCIDPHKGLFIPYGLGAVLVKDREAVYHSHRYRANYMQDSYLEEIPDNSADVSPELTKHFRGMRLWLPLRLYGAEVFSTCLREKLLLLKYMRVKLLESGYEVGPEPDLSVSYFWYPHPVADHNMYNKALLDEIHKDGRIYFSSTVIKGRFVIRIAVLSFRTKLHFIDKGLEVISEARARVDEKLGMEK